jgi:hypothetical protein
VIDKVKIIKQVIFTEKILKFIFYRKIEVIKLVNLSNSRDAILTSAKDTDLQDENYFTCHKLDHVFKE